MTTSFSSGFVNVLVNEFVNINALPKSLDSCLVNDFVNDAVNVLVFIRTLTQSLSSGCVNHFVNYVAKRKSAD